MALNGYLLNRKRRKRNRQRINRSKRAKIEPRTTYPYQGRLIECRSHGLLQSAMPVAPCTGQRAKVGVACTGQRGRTAECRAFNAESRVTFNSSGSVHDTGSKHGPEIMVSPATRCKVDNMLKVLQMNLTHLGPSKIKWLLSQNDAMVICIQEHHLRGQKLKDAIRKLRRKYQVITGDGEGDRLPNPMP